MRGALISLQQTRAVKRRRERLGRENWLHIGSPQAGPKVAAILSVVENCRRLKISLRDYLASILCGIADLPIRCLPDLTPSAWVAQRS